MVRLLSGKIPKVRAEDDWQVRESMEVLKRAYMSMDHLDVCLSHATMAAEMGYVRPVLDTRCADMGF